MLLVFRAYAFLTGRGQYEDKLFALRLNAMGRPMPSRRRKAQPVFKNRRSRQAV